MTSQHFRPNAPQVIHEVIDGEAVLVNLETGSYYSTDQVGADIWGMIEAGMAVSNIIDAIESKYASNRGEIESGVTYLVTQLQQEELIVAGRAQGPEDGASSPVASSEQANKPRFEQPVLSKYTDMEDLLLLDPIHDVDETGWPHVNPDHAV